MRFKPDWRLGIVVVICEIILWSLCVWQVRRNLETAGFVDSVTAKVHSEPLGAADLTKAPDELIWHTATLDGHFSGEFYRMTGRYERGEVGYDIIQAFEVDGAGTLIVNRGWVPRDYTTLDLAFPPDAQIHGLLMPTSEFGRDPSTTPLPADASMPERWPPLAYAAIARDVGATLPVVLIVGEPLDEDVEKPGSIPLTGYRPVPDTRPHLQYAATWGLIAVTLLFIYGSHAWQRARDEDAARA